ncbi:MAG: DUF87 domain-containing protein [bacterium]|nr:DUF87 domain-containing protein [Mycoplasmatota bacterium]MDD6756823.1 DUF87 domain-containing protein [bacterium]MDY2908265.1 DUF87 domain-containing protein [Candidatus Faecimonas sp.]
MFDRIVYISDHSANIRLKDAENLAVNLMNLHLVFEDKDKKVLGEVDDLDKDIVKARFLGEIVNGKLIGGTIRKPALDASIRVINQSEIPMIVGEDKAGYMKFGVSPFYNDFPVYLDVNNFFSNHFAIFGNSGSGKSCGVSRLFQNMFHDQRLFPYKANILLFDSSGEYYNAFKNLNSINPNYHYRFFSTNEVDGIGEKLRLPIWLLNASDLALLLQATNHSQLPIIERMLKLALIFSQNDMDANNYKNHLIAKAIMTILYTNETSPNKRNEIFSILASCSTPQFNLEAPVQGIGYTRKFRECFLIDSQGQFSESVLLTEYVSSFIKNEYDNYEPTGGVFYTLDTLEKALNFTLISEGWLRNENTYGDAVTLKVRLHALIVGEYAKFFDVPDYISLESYLSSLLISDGRKYQMVNFNLDDVDDDFAKVITKIYSRLVFEFAKGLKDRASIPFHIVVEEAHRYIQNDTDRFLIGYNIFERIAKEGRKYGVLLGLISQRPVELSDTVISQCSNFLIFKMNHPTDVDYIRKMVPNISDEIVEKQKTLQAGTCLGFGMAFKIPLICKLEMPNPAPWSGNCDVVTVWNGNGGVQANVRSVEAEVPSIPSIPSIPSVPRVPSSSSVSSESSLSIPMINNKPLDSGSNDTVNFSTDSNTSFVSVSDANRPKAMPDATMENTSNSSGFPDLDNLDLNDHTLEDDDIDTPARGVISGVSTFDNMANTFEPTSTVSNVPDLGIPGLNITQSDNSNQSNFISFGNNISDNSQSANPIDIVTPNGTPLISLTPEDK